MIPKKFKKIKIILLSVGAGSGSKYFQSFFDSHKEISMIPGYILMYLIPHWQEWNKNKNKNWNVLIKNLLKYHPSLLDTKILPGSSNLDSLGRTGKGSIRINKKKFIKIISQLLKNEKVNLQNFIFAIHYAYSKVKNENLSNKKIILFHIHFPIYVNEVFKLFPDATIVSMIREFKSNISNRLDKSLEKVNSVYLNETDGMFFKTRSYKNIIYLYLTSLKLFNNFNRGDHVAIKHEDLVTRKQNLLKHCARKFKIKFTKNILRSTIDGKIWLNKFYDLKKIVNGSNFEILKYNKSNYFYHELFWLEGLNFNFYKKYNYQLIYYAKNNLLNKLLLMLFIILPAKYEIKIFFWILNPKNIFHFFQNMIDEIKFPSKLKLYEKIAFYKHKWSNQIFPFSIFNYLIKKMKTNNISFYSVIYFVMKFLQMLYMPFSLIFNYIERVLMTLAFLIKEMINPINHPSKL